MREATIYKIEIKVDQSGNIFLDKSRTTPDMIKRALSEDESGIALELAYIVEDIEHLINNFETKFL